MGYVICQRFCLFEKQNHLCFLLFFQKYIKHAIHSVAEVQETDICLVAIRGTVGTNSEIQSWTFKAFIHGTWKTFKDRTRNILVLMKSFEWKVRLFCKCKSRSKQKCFKPFNNGSTCTTMSRHGTVRTHISYNTDTESLSHLVTENSVNAYVSIFLNNKNGKYHRKPHQHISSIKT